MYARLGTGVSAIDQTWRGLNLVPIRDAKQSELLRISAKSLNDKEMPEWEG
jgi:hypothetical protein